MSRLATGREWYEGQERRALRQRLRSEAERLTRTALEGLAREDLAPLRRLTVWTRRQMRSRARYEETRADAVIRGILAGARQHDRPEEGAP